MRYREILFAAATVAGDARDRAADLMYVERLRAQYNKFTGEIHKVTVEVK